MIKTLKSELRLRPTYDELVGMIESQGDPNRPSIEQVIDRRATLFRNNQFGSQFDNIDFLGLKKQEEDKVKNDLRRAQLNHHGVMNGVSTAVAGVQTSATSSRYTTPMTPREVYEGMEEEENDYPSAIIALDGALKKLELLSEQRKDIEDAKSDLDDVHHQSLPAGVEVHSMDVPVQSNQGYPPSLPAPPQAEDSEEDEEITALEQKVAYTQGFDPDKVLNDDSVNYRGLMFQLFVRDLLTDEMVDLLNKLPSDQKKKQYLVSIIEGHKELDEWNADFDSAKLSRKIKLFKRERRRVKSKRVEPSASSSSGVGAVVPSQPASSTPLRDIAVAGAKAGVETLVKAGATAVAKSFLP